VGDYSKPLRLSFLAFKSYIQHVTDARLSIGVKNEGSCWKTAAYLDARKARLCHEEMSTYY